ncbi:hypothetical protein BCR44DRAFT_1432805, partial [Catenaria anguillulae PL171]
MMSSSVQSPTFSPPWLSRPYSGGYADRNGLHNHPNTVGLHSHLSDLSATSYSTRSTFSVPALPRNSQVLTRAMERLSLSRRREFEAGRAARIAECYREKLMDIQRTQSGLHDWCISHAHAAGAVASVPPRVLHGSSAPELPRVQPHSFRPPSSRVHSHPAPKPAPARIDSSYLNSEADLATLFLEVATEDVHPVPKPKPSRQATNVTLNTHVAEDASAVTTLPQTDSPATTLARQTSDASGFHDHSNPRDSGGAGDANQGPIPPSKDQEPGKVVTMRAPRRSQAGMPSQTSSSLDLHAASIPIAPSPAHILAPPEDIDAGILGRLSTIFPYHTPDQLAEALVEASGNEFGAIAVLLKGESLRKRGNTIGDASAIHRRGTSVAFSQHGRALSTGTALSVGGGERLGLGARLKKKRKGLARRIKDLFRRT